MYRLVMIIKKIILNYKNLKKSYLKKTYFLCTTLTKYANQNRFPQNLKKNVFNCIFRFTLD